MKEAARSSRATASVLTLTVGLTSSTEALRGTTPAAPCGADEANATSTCPTTGESAGVTGSGDSELPVLETRDVLELVTNARIASSAFVRAMASSSLWRRASLAAAISSSSSGTCGIETGGAGAT